MTLHEKITFAVGALFGGLIVLVEPLWGKTVVVLAVGLIIWPTVSIILDHTEPQAAKR